MPPEGPSRQRVAAGDVTREAPAAVPARAAAGAGIHVSENGE
jgi:hypothetical protein